MGRHDLIAPFKPTKSFFDEIDAPEKQWIWFENSAHTPSLEEPEKFMKIIIKEVSRDRLKRNFKVLFAFIFNLCLQ